MQSASKPVLDPQRSDQTSNARCRVLLVDDHDDTREMFRMFLEGAGMEVASADSGVAALRLARADVPDVVVLDVRMPDLDGHDVVSVLRSRSETQATPIILVTGAVGPLNPRPDLGAADRVLTKPCRPEDLVAAIVGLTAPRSVTAG